MTDEIKTEYAIYNGEFVWDKEEATPYEYSPTIEQARANKHLYPEDSVIVEVNYKVLPNGQHLITKETYIE